MLLCRRDENGCSYLLIAASREWVISSCCRLLVLRDESVFGRPTALVWSLGYRNKKRESSLLSFAFAFISTICGKGDRP